MKRLILVSLTLAACGRDPVSPASTPAKPCALTRNASDSTGRITLTLHIYYASCPTSP